MTPGIYGPHLDNIKTVIPCIIDFFLTKDSMPLFIRKYSNTKVVLLSSKECYDFVDGYLKQNKIQGFNIGHLALSISDKYGIMNWSWSR